MHTRVREPLKPLDLESARLWGSALSKWLSSMPLGSSRMMGGRQRKLIYRLLGCRMHYGSMQLPVNWRWRVERAGLDPDSWEVVNERLWQHAVWQVQTTHVFRPERQEGIEELVSQEAEVERVNELDPIMSVERELKRAPATINGMEIPVRITRR